MRKKHYALMTLALAGGMAFGGAGVLSQQISDARAETAITTEEKSKTFAEPIGDTAGLTEKNEEKKNPQGKQNICLPEGAEIKEEKGNSLKILWQGRQITYFMSDTEEVSDADMTIEEVVGTAIKNIQACTRQNNIGKNIEISLQRNIPADYEIALDENGKTVSVMNKKNYGIRYYAVDVEGTEGHNYSLRINSVTGQTFGYTDFYDKAAAHHEYGEAEIKEMKPEYTSIAGDFVKESLGLGNIKDYYAFITGLVETENGSRDTFDIFCKTEEDDIVMVTIDQLEKTVLCFEVNPLLS